MFTRSWVISDLRDSDLSFQMWSHPKSRIKSVSTPSDYLSFLLVDWHANSYILLYIKKRNTGGHTCEYRFLFFFFVLFHLYLIDTVKAGAEREGEDKGPRVRLKPGLAALSHMACGRLLNAPQ